MLADEVRLPAGDVVFEKVRMLQAHELDREAVLEMAHHPAGVLPMVTGAPISGRWSVAIAAPDCEMSMTRHGDVDAVRQDQPRRPDCAA